MLHDLSSYLEWRMFQHIELRIDGTCYDDWIDMMMQLEFLPSVVV